MAWRRWRFVRLTTARWGAEMEWRALGTVDLRFYAADSRSYDRSAAADAIESFVDAAVSDAPAQ